MKVLVTGFSGFIGRELVKKCLDNDFNVTAIYNKTKPSTNSLNNSNNLKLIQADLSNFVDVKSIFEKNIFDAIFHVAGQTLKKDNHDAFIYFQNNFLSTLNLLESCRIFKIKKFILSSSIAVYGLSSSQNMPEYLPIDETHKLLPYDFYDLSKFFAENLCEYYNKKFQIDCSILRYSRVFGPLLDKGFVYLTVKNSLSNNPIQINGDISTDFVHVNDIVQANLLSLKSNGFQIYNIGSGEEKTLFDIANEIITITNSSSKIIFNNKEKSIFSLNISKARNLLGYSPLSIKQGLIDVVNNFKNKSDV